MPGQAGQGFSFFQGPPPGPGGMVTSGAQQQAGRKQAAPTGQGAPMASQVGAAGQAMMGQRGMMGQPPPEPGFFGQPAGMMQSLSPAMMGGYFGQGGQMAGGSPMGAPMGQRVSRGMPTSSMAQLSALMRFMR